MSTVPEPILAIFATRPSLPLPEAAKLLGMDAKTLRRHAEAGNISYISVGLGATHLRREFRLVDIEGFYDRIERRECPSTSPKTRRSTTSTSGCEVIGFMARRMRQKDAAQKRSKRQSAERPSTSQQQIREE